MKKWAIWKTILIVLASIIFVAGVTVGGVYLAGGFNPKVVYPDEISFVVDEKLFNNGQYEVTKDFQITIEATKDGDDEITEDVVTLTLDGNVRPAGKDSEGNDLIRNDVIIIPKTWTIGKPFTVILNKAPLTNADGSLFMDQDKNIVPWVVGGLSTISARSENKDKTAVEIKIAVDTPVYSIQASALDFNGKDLGDEITINDNFTIQTKFFPANSEYLYNDHLNDAVETKRSRLVYAESITSNIRAYFDENDQRYFTADSTSENDIINVYTFKNADTQISQYAKIFEENEEDPQATYTAVLSYLKTSKNDAVSTAYITNVVKASIKDFDIEKKGQTLSNIIVGKDYTLTMNATAYADDYIGAKVISSTDDEELLSMLKNVAISFEYSIDDGLSYTDASEVLGLTNANQVNYTDTKGRIFYFANTAPANPNFAFWTLSAKDEFKVRLTVVLFEELQEGYKIFTDEDEGVEDSYIIYLNTKVKTESPVSWTSTEDISMTLDYDGDRTKPVTYTLTNLARVPSENVYKSVQFFAYFRGKTVDEVKSVLGDEITDPVYHSGEYQFNNQILQLYPVSNELTVYDVGEFELYFATVQTDGAKYVIEDGKYVIIQPVATSIKVTVTKTLYEGSITAISTSTTLEEEGDEAENYYFNAGSNDTITIDFSVSPDSWEVFSEKMSAGRISFNVYSTTDEIINDYFVYGNPTLSKEELKVSYTLSIKGSFNETVNDLKVAKASLTDLDNTGLQPWSFVLDENYLLYTPKPVEILFRNENFSSEEYNQEIQVVQSLSNGTEPTLEIKYTEGGKEKIANSVQELLANFDIQLIDQHQNADIFKDSWTFHTNNDKAITLRSEGKDFAFPTTSNPESAILSVKFNSSDPEFDSLISNNSLKLVVTSTGIQKIAYDNNKDITTNSLITKTEDLGSIDISKYGASFTNQVGNDKSEFTIIFNDLVCLYLDENTVYDTSNYKFMFSQYIYSLEDSDIVELFGENGMLAFVGEFYKEEAGEQVKTDWEVPTQDDGEDEKAYATKLKNALATLEVKRMTIQHNFSKQHTLMFNIVDNNNTGVVRIALNLTILSNVTYSGSSSLGGEGKEIYASYGKFLNNNEKITVNYQNSDNEGKYNIELSKVLYDFAREDGASIVTVSDSEIGYQIVSGLVDGRRGSIILDDQENAGFLFNDFWSSESETFTIIYYLENTDNSYAPYYTFNVTVQRNIKVSNKQENGENVSYLFINATPDANNLLKYIDISRIVKDKNTPDIANITYQIQTNPYIKYVETESEDSNGEIVKKHELKRIEGSVPVFTYNQNKFTYFIDVYINQREVGRVYIDFTAGNAYGIIANRLTSGNTNEKAKIEEYEGITHITVTDGEWELNNSDVASEEKWNGYSVHPAAKYTDYTYTPSVLYESKFYNSTRKESNYSITYTAQGSDGFFGLANSEHYMIMRIYSGSGAATGQTPQFVMIVPTIVSRVGLNYAIYDNGLQATVEDVLNDNVSELISQSKFKTADAGSTPVIAYMYDTTVDDDAPSGIYYYSPEANQASIIIEEIKNDYSRTGLVAGIENLNDGTVQLRLNNLVGTETQYAYVTLKATITASGFEQVYYYVVRVKPNATLNKSSYPYAEGEEHLSIAKNDVGYETETVELDNVFDETTLAEGKTRFNITIDGISGVFADQPVIHYVESIEQDGQTVLPDMWEEKINVTFNNAQRTMSVNPKEAGVFKIVIARSYENVVGGVVYYTFVINQEPNYQIEFVHTNSNDNSNVITKKADSDTWVWQLDRNKLNDDDNIFTTYINLWLDTETADTVISNELQVNGILDEEDKACSWIYYNSSDKSVDINKDTGLLITDEEENKYTVAKNTLAFKLEDYLDKDYTRFVYLYTKFGLLGTLQIELKGSVEIEIDTITFEAGTTHDLNNLITNVNVNGEEAEHSTVTDSDSKYQYDIKTAKLVDAQNKEISANEFMLNGNDFVIFSSIKDLTARIEIVLNIIDVENSQTLEYTFYLDLDIAKNITDLDNNEITSTEFNSATMPLIDQTSEANAIIAGDSLEFEIEQLYNSINELEINSSDVKYSLIAVSGAEAFSEFTNQGTVVIQTNNVANMINCEAKLKVDLLNTASSIYQTFYIKIRFTVKPNVIVEVNYPNPENSTGEEGEEKTIGVEYIKTNTQYTTAQTFFEGTAPFASDKRFVISKVDEEQAGVDITKYTVKIVSMQNITISGNGNTIYSADDASNTLYDSATASVNVSNLKFTMGNWDIDKQESISTGETSTATFQLTCNQVTKQYTIVLLENIYDITLNKVNNNVDASGVETFYVDTLTQSTNIFEQDRMANFTVKKASENANISTIIETKYTMLFEQQYPVATYPEDQQFIYKTVDIQLRKENIGQSISIDLGQSFAGYSFVGIYVNDGKDITGTYIDSDEEKELVIGSQGYKFIPQNTDYSEQLFNKNPELISRLELTYAGQYKVDYVKYGDSLKFNKNADAADADPTATPKDYTIEQGEDDVDKVFTLQGFKYEQEVINIKYQYLITVDLALKQDIEFTTEATPKATNNIVNKIQAYQRQNLISTLGVYHPSSATGELLTAKELESSNVNIFLQVYGLDYEPTSDVYIQAIKNAYEGEEFKPYYGESIINSYLDISAVQSENEEITDYIIRGRGASNQGNNVILKMKYEVTVSVAGEELTFTKDYYFVMKVLPDYDITYLKAGKIAPNEEGIITNEGSSTIYTMSEVEISNNENVYKKQTLAGNDSSQNPIVSVKHTNDLAGMEIGAQNFTYTMTIDDEQGSITYNQKINVNAKLADTLDESGWNVTATGTKGEENYQIETAKWQDLSDKAELNIVNAREVQFGVQYYRLEAVDAYGYKFIVCFALSNVNLINPSLNYSGSLLEGSSFDIGSDYKRVSIAATGETDSTGSDGREYLNVTEQDLIPSSSSVETLSLSNIDAWGFDKALYEVDEALGITDYSAYFNSANATSIPSLNASYIFSDPTKASYLTVPKFLNLRVMGVKFYYNNKLIGDLGERTETLATSKLYLFGTESDLFRGPTANKYIVPQLEGSVYGTKNEAQVDIVITIGYDSQGYLDSDFKAEELYDISSTVTIRRGTTFIANANNVVQDGRDFDVKDYVTVSQRTGVSSQPVTNYDVYDDTLVVTNDVGGSVNFKLEFWEGDYNTAHVTTVNVNVTNTYNYPRTEYISLSNKFGETLTKNHKFKITNITASEDNAVKFRYANYTNEHLILDEEIGIANLAKDKINIEDSRRLYQNSTNISKYYLISIKDSSDPKGDATDEYNYTQTFNVTGYYYSMAYNYAGDTKNVVDYLEVDDTTDENVAEYIIPFTSWTDGMWLNTAKGQDLTEVKFDTFSSQSLNKLYFDIKTETAAGVQTSGAATIDEYGTIRTNQKFDINSHFITVAIRLKASGVDGDFSEKDIVNDVELTAGGKGIFTFKLTPRGTTTPTIALSNVAEVIKTEDTTHTLTLQHRAYVDGEIKYEDRTFTFAGELKNITASLKQTTLWAGEKATTETGNNVKVNGINLNVGELTLAQVNPETKRFHVGTPLMELVYTKSEDVTTGTNTGLPIGQGNYTYVSNVGWLKNDSGTISADGNTISFEAGVEVYTAQLSFSGKTLSDVLEFIEDSTKLTGVKDEPLVYTTQVGGITYYLLDSVDYYDLIPSTLINNVDTVKLDSFSGNAIPSTSYTFGVANNEIDYFMRDNGTGIIYTILSNFAIKKTA